jgi:hypothetical protein
MEGARISVYFRDMPKTNKSSMVTLIDLSKSPDMLTLAPVQSDPLLDNLPIRDGELYLSKPPLTIAAAIDAFLKHFPLGFKDQRYLGDLKNGERSYKNEAHQRYVDLLDHGRGDKLLAAGDIDELVRLTLKVAGPPLNLLSPNFELAPFKEGLLNPKAARNYFNALFEVLRVGAPEKSSFEKMIAAVEALPSQGASKADSWPVLTLLPFIARPSAFMFLKPTVTKAAAEWLAYDLKYDSTLNWRTYEQLIGMSRLLEDALRTRPEPGLHPADFIDIQSFIWVVGNYDS